MDLQYIYIKRYRNLIEQGINLSNKYFINYDSKNNKIHIDENPFFIDNFYGVQVNNLKCIVGENGTGKTTILSYIKDILAFPMYDNSENLDFLIIFKNTEDKLLVYTNGFNIKNKNISLPKSIKDVDILTLNELIKKSNIQTNEFRKRNTILGAIEKFNNSSIVYLSNTFDGHSEKLYSPRIKPYVHNLSTNFTVKNEEKSFKHNEVTNSIKLILNSKDFIPEIKLPENIRITVKRILVIEQFRENSNNKETPEHIKALINVLTDIYETAKLKNTDEVKFLLYAYLLLQVKEFILVKSTKLLVKNIKQNITNFDSIIVDFLQNDVEITDNEIKKSNSNYPYKNKFEEKEFKQFINDYLDFIESTLSLYSISNKNNNEFTVPLNQKYESKINQLLHKNEFTSDLGIEILNFSWHEMSTGETMMLRLFSNLYKISTNFKNFTPKDESIFFLFDEIETFFHPHWQKKLIKSLLDFINHYFSDYKINILLTTHSPFIISDIIKTDLLFLKKEKDTVIIQKSLNEHMQTFASNIHTLLSDSFFLQNGLIGDFANEKINEVISLLLDSKLKNIIEKRTYIENVINIIGEPAIKIKLLELLENRMRSNLIKIKTDIDKIKKN